MVEQLVHLLCFLVSNVLFGSVVAAFLLRRVGTNLLGGPAIILVGLGLAPFLITWVLNMVLLLWPGVPRGAAMGLVFAVFGGLSAGAGHGWRMLRDLLASLPRALVNPTLWPYLFFSGAMVFGTYIMLVYKPLVDHDIQEYGVQGRLFFESMAIRYAPHHYDPATGFYYVGLHGFSFPLLFTWEGLMRWATGTTGDAWVRVQTPWSAWLLVSFVWAWMRRFGEWLAAWTVGAFTLTLGFLYLNTIYHVDPVRVFLFSTSLAAFAAVLQRPSTTGLVLWGVLLGAHALTHSLGMILAPFMMGVYLLVATDTWRERIGNILVALAAFIVAGGFHYVLDIFIGTGWLFKDITWF
jgi:hypothetical protein